MWEIEVGEGSIITYLRQEVQVKRESRDHHQGDWNALGSSEEIGV